MQLGIIGGGLMGSGIAETCSRSGVDVTVVEADEARVEHSRAAIGKSLDRGVKAGKLSTDDRDAALERLSFTTRIDDINGVDGVIEAIVENEAAKQEVFAKLDQLLPDAEFLASNTSSVPIMRLAAATSNPERVIGMHFFNPVPVLPLVEIVRSIKTSEQTLNQAHRFAQETLSKKTINSKDQAGFVVNALLIPYILSAIRMYESGFADKEDIDNGMVLGCAHPMGPLALADLVGLDTLQAVAESIYSEFRDPAAISPPLLNRMVEAGMLGRKSGQGFYEYRK